MTMNNRPQQRQHMQTTKLVISAAALAATIGGWAVLSTQPAPGVVGTSDVAVVSPPPDWLLMPPSIPTLQPVVGTISEVQVPIAPAPVSTAPAPALREVTVPPARPAPVTVTQSSR